MTDSVSTPGWPCGPSTSVMTPSPRSSGEGKRSISMTTLSCGFAPFAPGSPTEMLWREDGAVDADESLAVALEVGADEGAGGPFENADDLAGGVLDVRCLAGDADQHLVAGGGVERSCPRG